MDWAWFLSFLRRMFFAGDSLELSPDLARDIFFTGVTFVIGWVLSLSASKQRLKGRIINELILSQRELVGRAYPEVRGGKWKAADTRETWMLDPFVARIKFLIASLQDEKSLKLKELDALEHYVGALEDFIAQWAKTSRRQAGYHYKYDQTYVALRAATMSLGLTRMRRLGGLKPRDDLLDGLGKEQPPSTGAAPAPAE